MVVTVSPPHSSSRFQVESQSKCVFKGLRQDCEVPGEPFVDNFLNDITNLGFAFYISTNTQPG